MRTKKVFKNASIGILTYLIGFIPQFILRKVFLETLGEEILGLNSLFSNLITYLSIFEMGIGSAIVFSLYKPYSEKNRVKIKGYLNYYSRFYKIVGTIIFILGLFLVPYLPIFVKNDVNIAQAQFYFILFLINTYSSYLFTYKFCILNVAQEGYKISILNSVTKVVTALIQYWALVYYSNFSIYLFIQIIINLIQYLTLNIYINNQFPWLGNIKGEISKEEKVLLIKNVKALFIHKIGSIIVFGTDSIVISIFINLSTVARYNNYNMIISAIQGVIKSMTTSIVPSIGNLLVEKDGESAYEVHKRLFLFNFWVASMVSITLYNVTTQFVTIWLGKNSIIDNFTLAIILLNFYFYLMRNTVEAFKDGSGRYHEDRYASLFESAINLFISIILVKKIGLVGVFIGTLVSNLSVVFWVKPKITYKYVFKLSLIEYFKIYFKYCLIAIVPLFVTVVLTSSIKMNFTILMLILNCLINIFVINIIYLLVFWNNKEFIYYKKLFINLRRWI